MRKFTKNQFNIEGDCLKKGVLDSLQIWGEVGRGGGGGGAARAAGKKAKFKRGLFLSAG